LRENKKGKKAAKPAKAPFKSSGSPMDVNLLEEIVKLMAANDLNTVDVREGDKRVVLKRGIAVSPVTYASHGPQSYSAPAPAAAPAAAAPAKAAAPVDENAGLVAVKSPMVGTYYSASSPDAKPFVSVGTTVDEETDVCVIEAMKVFNNIKAETRGTIAKVLCTNGQTVEFGQTLFLVKP